MAWVGKELEDELVPRPCLGQGQLLEQAAPSPSELPWDAAANGECPASMGGPSRGLTALTTKSFLPVSELNLL